MFTVTTNLYNECDLEYYVQSVSKATSNVAGLCNQLINIYWRMSEDGAIFEEMETAFAAEDASTSAKLLGSFIKVFLMAAIPDKSESGYYQEVSQLM